MKKARAWLDKRGVAYDFHDYKAAGIERAKLEGWAKKAGWETLLNRAGTTFRKLPDKDKDGLDRKEGHRADAGAAVDDQAARCWSFAAASCWSDLHRTRTAPHSSDPLIARDCGDFLPGAIRSAV